MKEDKRCILRAKSRVPLEGELADLKEQRPTLGRQQGPENSGPE